MTYQAKDNTGSLFKNDKRETDSHPNARGSCVIDGVEYWVDAWTNEAKSGDKYQSLKFKRKEPKRVEVPVQQRTKPAAPVKQPERLEDMIDDIPW